MKNTDEFIAEPKHIRVPIFASDHAAPPITNDAQTAMMDHYRALGAPRDPVEACRQVMSDAASFRADHAAGRVDARGNVIDHAATDRAYERHVQQLNDAHKSPEQRAMDDAFAAAGADRDPDRAAELAARINSARHRIS